MHKEAGDAATPGRAAQRAGKALKTASFVVGGALLFWLIALIPIGILAFTWGGTRETRWVPPVVLWLAIVAGAIFGWRWSRQRE